MKIDLQMTSIQFDDPIAADVLTWLNENYVIYVARPITFGPMLAFWLTELETNGVIEIAALLSVSGHPVTFTLKD